MRRIIIRRRSIGVLLVLLEIALAGSVMAGSLVMSRTTAI
jgi:hypothetical protein